MQHDDFGYADEEVPVEDWVFLEHVEEEVDGHLDGVGVVGETEDEVLHEELVVSQDGVGLFVRDVVGYELYCLGYF